MVRKLMTLVIIAAGLSVAACNTVRGAGADVQSAANCTENVIHQGGCEAAGGSGQKSAPPDCAGGAFCLSPAEGGNLA